MAIKKTFYWACGLIILFAAYYLFPLESRLLWQPDETRYAEISREMLVNHQWIVPHFLDLRYFEKPIAGYWINTIGQWIFGHNNFAVRIGGVFSTTLCALMAAWLAWKMWRDSRVALLSGIIFLTGLLVYGVGTYAVLDPMIAMWLTLAMCSFWSAVQATTRAGKLGGYLLLGIACGLGVMTKGFLALAVPVIGVLPWVWAQKRWREVLTWGWLSVVVCVLTVLPWGIAISRQAPDFWHYFFWIEHIQRFARDDAQHKAPFWYYLPVFIMGSLPWLGLLPGSLKRAWQDPSRDRNGLYLLGWVIMPLLFFSVAKGKLVTYILPCFVPLAMLLARYGVDAAIKGIRTLRINGYINMAFGLLGVAAGIAICPLLPFDFKIWSPVELYKSVLVILIFGGWALCGWLATVNPSRRWVLAAGSPLVLALLVGYAIPDKVVESKQPQVLLDMAKDKLAPSRYLLSNSVGIAAGLGWELKRSDIIMYSQKGELAYGLSYPDAQGKFVSDDDFRRWLAEHRQTGLVSLVLQLSKGQQVNDLPVPIPDYVYVMGRIALLQYRPQ